ncbi:MAG: hypothetical protein RJA63_1720 [Pseudomonadota bacterium]|jgi:hypothetical protein
MCPVYPTQPFSIKLNIRQGSSDTGQNPAIQHNTGNLRGIKQGLICRGRKYTPVRQFCDRHHPPVNQLAK